MNELQLSNNLNVITAEINSYKQVAGQAIFEIGRRLKWVKENDLVHGEFGKWLEKVDIDQYDASKFIKAYDEFSYLGTYPNLGQSKIFQIISLPKNINKEEFINQQHTIPSTGEQKTVDEMTVKELREVKVALKQAEEEKEHLGKLLTEERNKPVKVETRVETKVIDNTDYQTINQLKSQIQNNQQKIQSIERQKGLLEERLRQEEDDANEFRKMKEEIERLHRQKDDLHRQIESATAISGLYVEIEHLLSTKLAPIKYSRALTERRDSEVAMRNLKEIINMVDEWSKEMKSYLPNENKDYIDVEVIEYE
jgi:hypothetical protein